MCPPVSPGICPGTFPATGADACPTIIRQSGRGVCGCVGYNPDSFRGEIVFMADFFKSMRRCAACVLCLALYAGNALAQQASDFIVTETEVQGEGWEGFTDLDFLINAFLTLVLASVLGAIIAYHPRHRQTADTLQEIEAPKVYVTYAVIGSIIGIMVVKYGLVIGFVLFGIGGLIRFRTVLRSATLTGHVIYVTLIGLSCGLELPHVAVLATLFGFVLIYILEAHITYCINLREIPAERLSQAAVAYRETLEAEGFRIMSETKSPRRGRLALIIRSSRLVSQLDLEELLDAKIEAPLRGSLDFEIN